MDAKLPILATPLRAGVFEVTPKNHFGKLPKGIVFTPCKGRDAPLSLNPVRTDTGEVQYGVVILQRLPETHPVLPEEVTMIVLLAGTAH